jgi:hypothetical protein
VALDSTVQQSNEGATLADVVHTVLISPATKHPWGERALEPQSVASLWVGGSGNWVFTSLLPDGAGGSVRPLGPDDEASALLIGIAVHLVQDEAAAARWQARRTRDGDQRDVSRTRDATLVTAAKGVVKEFCRLSFVSDGLGNNSAALHQMLGEIDGVDVEVLSPQPPPP